MWHVETITFQDLSLMMMIVYDCDAWREIPGSLLNIEVKPIEVKS